MFIPPLLYGLTDRDLGAPYARLYAPPQATGSVAAVEVSAQVQVQTDRPVVLRTLAALILPGAAQSLTEARMEFGLSTLDAHTILFMVPATGTPAAVRMAFNWQGEIIIPPGVFIRCRATFSGGAAVNLVTFQAVGATIPLGTLQLP